MSKMKTVKVTIHCSMCGKFKVEHEIDTNEHGYFTLTEAHCPECLAVMVVVVDHLSEDVEPCQRT